MVAHVTEFHSPFRQPACGDRRSPRNRRVVRRRPASVGHLRLVVDNEVAGGSVAAGPAPTVGTGGRMLLSGDLAARPAPSALDELRHRLDELGSQTMRRLGFAGGATMAAVVVACGLVALMVSVRSAQGTPPADFQFSGEVQGESVAGGDAAPGDLVVVAGAGDSMWSLAGEYAPGVDRRSAVATLVDANGGATIVVGQAIVIPSHLLQ